MPIAPVAHPQRTIKFVAVAVVAVSDPRYKGTGKAPTVLNAVLVDQHGHAWHWDGITERGARMRMRPKKSAAKTRTRSGARNKLR
jgi:hypothetical protein